MDPLKQSEELVEGFDDDGETGAGEKLLGLLQKMEIENILVIVAVWNIGAQIGPSQVKGGELFKVVVDQAKELLNIIHAQITEQENEARRKQDEEQARLLAGKKMPLGSKVYNISVERDKSGASQGLIVRNAARLSPQNKRQSPQHFNNQINFDPALDLN